MTTLDIGLRSVLGELSHEIEFARAPGGGWLGVFTVQPLALNDLGASYLQELGLIEVLEWDEGYLVMEWTGARRTPSLPSRARLSTDGWAVLDRC